MVPGIHQAVAVGYRGCGFIWRYLGVLFYLTPKLAVSSGLGGHQRDHLSPGPTNGKAVC